MRVGCLPVHAPVDALEVRQVPITKGANADFGRDYAELLRMIRELCGSHTAPRRISLGFPGPLKDDGSGFHPGSNVRHWEDFSLCELSEDTCCPVVLGVNDAQAAVYADAVFSPQAGEFVGIVLGSGVGGAVHRIIDGASYVFPSEPGHACINCTEDAPECTCGARGCWETYCGGEQGLSNLFGKSGADVTIHEWQIWAGYVAAGLLSMATHHVDVGSVILYGGVICKQDWLVRVIRGRLSMMRSIRPSPQVSLTCFGEMAGVVGALGYGRRMQASA